MTWKVDWLPEALDDVKGLDGSLRPRVLSAVQTKIATDPKRFGEELRADTSTPLAGFRKLRVGFLRIIYFVFADDNRVLLTAVGRRAEEEVYARASDRVKALRRKIDAEFEEVGKLVDKFRIPP